MNSVKLVGVTRPINLPDVTNTNDLIAYTARVSNPANQSNSLTAPRLMKYLINNKHWSPFEMISLTMEIVTTRDIARQILRHRSFSFQEFSQRYAEADNYMFRDARLQDPKNRQNSIELSDDNRNLNEEFRMKQAAVLAEVQDVYKWALDKGIAKEQARAVLPEGLTQSTLYMAGTLRSWIHYVDLRASNGTQLEHQHIARACRDIIKSEFPVLVDYFDSQQD